MAELRGGTTISGYAALHSGMKEAYLGGNLTVNGNIVLPSSGATISTLGVNGVRVQSQYGWIDVGVQTSAGANIYTDRAMFKFNKEIEVNGSKVWHAGNISPLSSSASYVSADTTGSTAYPRLVVNNSGASEEGWIRVGNTGSHGLLPYSNGTSSIGTASWKFRDMHAVNFYEDGTALSSKYAAAGHNHDSAYVNRTGDTFTGNLVSSTRQSGVYGTYNSSKIDHIWSMGTAYKVEVNGANFGNLYGLAYKHTNNTTGGTMAGGHQVVWVENGSPKVALGTNIWTSGSVLAESATISGVAELRGSTFLGSTLNVTSTATFDNGIDVKGTLNMYNQNIEAVNKLIFNDPGVGEGLEWATGSGWRMFESSDAINNTTGNIQITSLAAAPQFTIATDGKVSIDSSGASLALYGGSGNHTFMEFYARGGRGSVRSSWMGFGSLNATNFAISNAFNGGDISLLPGSGGLVTAGGKEVYAKGGSISWGTANPSGGTSGDIYIQY